MADPTPISTGSDSPHFTVTPTPGGWLALCMCGWERFEQRRPLIDRALEKHSCPKPKNAPTSTPPRPRTDWANREDSTWIDKL